MKNPPKDTHHYDTVLLSRKSFYLGGGLLGNKIKKKMIDKLTDKI